MPIPSTAHRPDCGCSGPAIREFSHASRALPDRCAAFVCALGGFHHQPRDSVLSRTQLSHCYVKRFSLASTRMAATSSVGRVNSGGLVPQAFDETRIP